MSSPLVSIIVPVYNVEEYIAECLDSITEQSYINIEIIIVDDGSTDGSHQVIEAFAKKDKRIRVIRQVNSGLSGARNTGIRNAKGDWLAFVDSDDRISSAFIESLVSAAISESADVSVCGTDKIYCDGRARRYTSTARQTINNLGAMSMLFTKPLDAGDVTTWNKLYRRSIFIDNKIQFPKGRVHEDNYTTYKLFFFAKRVTFIPDSLYYYRQRRGSITDNKASLSRIGDKRDALMETRAFLALHGADLFDELACYEERTRMGILSDLLESGVGGPELKRELRADIIGDGSFLKNKYSTASQRLNFIMLRLGLPIFAMWRKIISLSRGRI